MLMYYIISILQFFATNLRKNLYVYYTQKQNYVLLYIGSKQKQSVVYLGFLAKVGQPTYAKDNYESTKRRTSRAP